RDVHHPLQLAGGRRLQLARSANTAVMTGALDHLRRAPLGPHDPPQTQPLADGGETKPRSQWQLFRRRFARHKAAMAGLFVLVLLAFVCYGAALVAPLERGDQNLGAAGLRRYAE